MATQETDKNTLYYGDNLEVLRLHIKDESADLIYLDPPFNSNQTYNVLFAERDGSGAAAQIKAFEDTWRWDRGAAAAYQEIVEHGPQNVSKAIQAFRSFLGDSDMTAYLAMMAPRLVELRRALKSTGSIYLHCDPTASHYLKILMDAVFAPENFRNEIIWHYRRWTAQAKKFQELHDIVLFYTRNKTYTFNLLLTAYTAGSLQRKEQGILHRFKKGEKPVLVSNREVQAKGVPENDVWHIPFVAPSAKERLGYPTQKPQALLERIINSSSNEGDVVLDPFCGCGTTVAVANRLKRHWIGIDITHLAIGLIKHRLQDAFGSQVNATYQVVGEPVSVADAGQLAQEDPYQFQWWALGLIGARPVEQKKGSDKGIDGRLFFHDEGAGDKTKQVILSVKSGKLHAQYIRDLRGVLEREKAEIAALLCMEEPTKPMRTEAASTGFYTSPFSRTKHLRLQILTISDLLKGKGLDCPQQLNVSFKKAPQYGGEAIEEGPELPL